MSNSHTTGNEPGNASKRRFLELAGSAGLGLSLGLKSSCPSAAMSSAVVMAAAAPAQTGGQRRTQALQKRMQAAQNEFGDFDGGSHPTNGDEYLPGAIAMYSKGLPHNALGEVDSAAYQSLVYALANGSSDLLAKVPMGTTPPAKFSNARAGFNFSLIGQDAQGFVIAPPPAFGSAETGAEMAELYWAALIRDLPFSNYSGDATLTQAAADLANLSGYNGPASPSPDNLFRMTLPGALDGPWLSQFFWMPLTLGAYSSEQMVNPPIAGVDFHVTYADWLTMQRGGGGGATPAGTTTRYIATARDLTRVLQLDVSGGTAFQHEFMAMLNLVRLAIPRNPALPALAPNDNAALNFGTQMLPQLIAFCYTTGLTPVFWQKWQLHRRIRPEAYAGRVHNHISGAASYPVSSDLLASNALAASFSRNGNYLLPQAWKGGCPLHPSYPSAHAVVAGSAVTLLKAFYKGDAVIPKPVVANADGSALLAYAGTPLTVEGELNKLAANIGMSRIHTGIHYRSDCERSLMLGERVAIAMLEDLKPLYADQFAGFSFRGFDGTNIIV
jgi:hypothetical protein